MPNYKDAGIGYWSPEAIKDYQDKYESYAEHKCVHKFVAYGFGRKGFCKWCNADGHTTNEGEIEWKT